MHSNPAAHQQIEISDHEIATYARSLSEWRERYLQGQPIRQEPRKFDPSRLDEAMFAAARSSRRLTGYCRKTLLVGACAWLSLKVFQP